MKIRYRRKFCKCSSQYGFHSSAELINFPQKMKKTIFTRTESVVTWTAKLQFSLSKKFDEKLLIAASSASSSFSSSAIAISVICLYLCLWNATKPFQFQWRVLRFMVNGLAFLSIHFVFGCVILRWWCVFVCCVCARVCENAEIRCFSI